MSKDKSKITMSLGNTLNETKPEPEPEDTRKLIGESDITMPWELMTVTQAYKAAEEKHLKPGEAGHWCNPKLREKIGWEGWEVAHDAPHVGDEVLGKMPIEMDRKRTAFFQNQSKTQKKIRADQKQEAMEKIAYLRSNKKIYNVPAQIS